MIFPVQSWNVSLAGIRIQPALSPLCRPQDGRCGPDNRVMRQGRFLFVQTGTGLAVLRCGPCRVGLRHVRDLSTASASPLRPFFLDRTCRGLGRLPNLVRHPLTEVAVIRLVRARLHKRDAGPAVRNAVAIENRQVHKPVAKDVSDERRERLSAVNVGKEPIAGKLVGDSG